VLKKAPSLDHLSMDRGIGDGVLRRGLSLRTMRKRPRLTASITKMPGNAINPLVSSVPPATGANVNSMLAPKEP
jgi:hypothetical protein